MALTGISQDKVGTVYDCAVGFLDPDSGNTLMVGYVLAPGTTWSEATDINDEQRIIQISSPNSTDRYTYYPKASQGDWSGGYRQVFFETANQYYSSDGNINVIPPGNLTLLNRVSSVHFTAAPLATNGISIAVGSGNSPSGTELWIGIGNSAGTHNAVTIAAPGADLTQMTILDGSFVNGLSGATGGTFGGVVAGVANGGSATNGVQIVDHTGASTTQLSNDAVSNTVNSLLYLNLLSSPNIYYITNSGTQINHVPISTPAGNATGTVDVTTVDVETLVFIETDGVSLFYGTQLPNISPPGPNFIFTYNGVTSTKIGQVPGTVVGCGSANGVVYLLVRLSQGTSQVFTGYALYQINGSTLSVFDDLRNLPGDFQNEQPIFSYTSSGGIDSDGRYLYVAIPGFNLLAYDLEITGNPVYQIFPEIALTSSLGVQNVTTIVYPGNVLELFPSLPLGTSPFVVQLDGSNNLVVAQQTGSPAPSGEVTLSYMDFGAPTTVKTFRSVDIEMVTSVPPSGVAASQVQISYRIDNQTSFTPLGVPAVTTEGNLSAYFPAGTKGSRVQIQITLTTTALLTTNPVVRSVSVSGRLGRTWTLTLECQRDQRTREGWGPGQDVQGLTAQQKLANLINVYNVTAGDCTLFVPSPTQASGTEQVQATMEQYTWTANAQPGPYNTEFGATDIEGTVQVTLVESL